jgi:Flp pilus assembly protein TadG
MIEAIRNFIRDTRAAVAFETVLLTPILVWAYIGSFVFFDAYRVYNTSVKATYMVADMLSRQTNMVYGHDI